MDYQTPQFYRVMRYAAEADRDVVDLVSGSPDWGPPTGIREGLVAYADSDPEAFRYPPSPGSRSLREAIARRRDVPTEQVIVTNGAGEANHLAMTAGYDQFDGDEILLVDPVYPYYAGRAEFIGASTSFVPVEPDGALDPDAVRERASDETAVIVVTTPNNPTGAVYPRETMRDLVAIAEAVDALLVSDEVYDRFDYSGQFTSALAFDSPNRLVTNAFSKSMAVTGLRVGYAIVENEAVREHARTQHMLTNVTGSRPAQFAAARALETTDSDYYAANRERMADRIDRFSDALDDIGATYTDPDGAFYVMARFDGFPGTFENAFDLIDAAGVAAMPGEAFGDARREWFRFALLTPRIDDALDRLSAFFG